MTTYLFSMSKYFLNNLEGTEGENKQVLGKIAVLVLDCGGGEEDIQVLIVTLIGTSIPPFP
jgi:hypothetical protein